MEPVTKNLPVIAMRGLNVFPRMNTSFDLERPISVRALERAMENGEEIFLVTQKEIGVEQPEEKDLYEIGTVARVTQILRVTDHVLRVMMEGACRARLKRLWQREPFLQAQVELVEESAAPRSGKRTEAMLRQTYASVTEYAELAQKLPDDVYAAILSTNDPGYLADFIAQQLNLRYQDKQDILSELRPLPRLQRMNEILRREIEVTAMEQDIESKVRSRVGKIQKDFVLREQIKVLQDEIGEGGEDEELDEYRAKIAKAHLNEETEKKLLKDVDRLARQPFGSAEASVLRNYLDTCMEMPWGEETKERASVEAARRILDHDHYGLQKVKERILEFIAVRQLNPEAKGQILCLVGPPGVGKTAIAEGLAQRIASGDVPAKLRDKQVFLLDLTSLVAGTQFRITLCHCKKSAAEIVHLLLRRVHFIDSHTAAHFNSLCKQFVFVFHVTFGGIEQFGQHIVTLGQRDFHAGESFLHADFFFLKAVDCTDPPDDDQKHCNQKDNSYDHIFIPLFLCNIPLSLKKSYIFQQDIKRLSHCLQGMDITAADRVKIAQVHMTGNCGKAIICFQRKGENVPLPSESRQFSLYALFELCKKFHKLRRKEIKRICLRLCRNTEAAVKRFIVRQDSPRTDIRPCVDVDCRRRLNTRFAAQDNSLEDHLRTGFKSLIRHASLIDMVQPHVGRRKMRAAVASLMEILNLTFFPLAGQQIHRFQKRLIDPHFFRVQVGAECLSQLTGEEVSHLLLHQGFEFFLGVAAHKNRAADTAAKQHRDQDHLERSILHRKVSDQTAQYTDQTDAQTGERLLLIGSEFL